jgi:hypothetical protein
LQDERAPPHPQGHAQRLRCAHLLRRPFSSSKLPASVSSPQSYAAHTSQQFPVVHVRRGVTPSSARRGARSECEVDGYSVVDMTRSASSRSAQKLRPSYGSAVSSRGRERSRVLRDCSREPASDSVYSHLQSPTRFSFVSDSLL